MASSTASTSRTKSERTIRPRMNRRVFHLVTLGAWLLFVWNGRSASPTRPLKVMALWALAIALVVVARSVRASGAAAKAGVSPEHDHRRRRRRRSEHCAQAAPAPGVRHQPRRLRRRRAEAEERRARRRRPARRTGQLPEIVRLFDVERVVIAFSSESGEEMLEVRCGRSTMLDVQVDIVPRLYETRQPERGDRHPRGLPVISLPPPRCRRRSASRSSGRSTSLGARVGLAVTAPLFAFIAWRSSATRPARSSSVRRGSARNRASSRRSSSGR